MTAGQEKGDSQEKGTFYLLQKYNVPGLPQ